MVGHSAACMYVVAINVHYVLFTLILNLYVLEVYFIFVMINSHVQ